MQTKLLNFKSAIIYDYKEYVKFIDYMEEKVEEADTLAKEGLEYSQLRFQLCSNREKVFELAKYVFDNVDKNADPERLIKYAHSFYDLKNHAADLIIWAIVSDIRELNEGYGFDNWYDSESQRIPKIKMLCLEAQKYLIKDPMMARKVRAYRDSRGFSIQSSDSGESVKYFWNYENVLLFEIELLYHLEKYQEAIAAVYKFWQTDSTDSSALYEITKYYDEDIAQRLLKIKETEPSNLVKMISLEYFLAIANDHKGERYERLMNEIIEMSTKVLNDKTYIDEAQKEYVAYKFNDCSWRLIVTDEFEYDIFGKNKRLSDRLVLLKRIVGLKQRMLKVNEHLGQRYEDNMKSIEDLSLKIMGDILLTK